MATIGTFTSTENGFTGSIRTLALNVKARIARVENPSDKGPQFRVYAGSVELGAAWQKTSGEGRDYLSVKLDDPSFPAPIYATLSEVECETRLPAHLVPLQQGLTPWAQAAPPIAAGPVRRAKPTVPTHRNGRNWRRRGASLWKLGEPV